MENTNAIDEIKRMAEILSASRTERKAFILMPTFKGFDVYEVSEPLAQHCIFAEALRKSAEADSTGKGQSNIPDVINSVCGICGKPALENNLCYEHLVCNEPKPPQQTDL